ncbi:hypothetical protein GMPD_03630 [Geomonas paludis]|uniref:Uncharacterized protein n=1 Tax=Geomonas paludis TaxID=2740185 RepID=A0A6V8MRB1_9BACT|nr:hypothetical protein GMPD_03630 [Geomonas paludis]
MIIRPYKLSLSLWERARVRAPLGSTMFDCSELRNLPHPASGHPLPEGEGTWTGKNVKE